MLYRTEFLLTTEKKEIYKKLNEENHLVLPTNGKPNIKFKNNDLLKENKNMVQEENNRLDGADEQMLSLDSKANEKRDEVKFIKSDHQNGDAKIDIGVVNNKTFTGMSKEELMKYANDPFWVRVRWIFFIAFWAIWAGMLVGAILIIIDAPKCAAPEPLPWYKQGQLAKFSGEKATEEHVTAAKKVKARGVIYELPAESTYAVHEPWVQNQIKDLVSIYKDTDINVVLDITANYVSKNSQLMENALKHSSQRSAFIWQESAQVPNNWLSIVNGSAWTEIQPGNFVLSQFGDNLFDLHMSDPIVKEELKKVLQNLLQLGVQGIRLKNSKHFLVHKTIQDEEPAEKINYIHTQYDFWTHSQTTFQEGLGDLLYDYLGAVKNISTDAFLSITDDIVRPEVYHVSESGGGYGIDLPVYGRFTHFLSTNANKEKLTRELENTFAGLDNNTWLQWNFEDDSSNNVIPADAYALFMSMIPGTPVIAADSYYLTNVSTAVYDNITEFRESSSFMHGDFKIINSEGLLAYSRLKSGKTGYFVVYNPNHVNQVSDFSVGGDLPSKLTVQTSSQNCIITEKNAKSDSIEVSPKCTIVYTYYVPISGA